MEYKILTNFLDKSINENILNYTFSLKWMDGKIRSRSKDDSIRTSKVSFAIREDFKKEILKNIKEKIQRVNGSEFQLTMNSNGDFYKPHPDTDKKVKIPKIRQRKFTLVYYVFNEPKPFTGGDLVIYEKTNEEGKDYNENDFITITPENNMLVMFPSEYWHEVKTVNNDGNLTNNRFTINIWIH